MISNSSHSEPLLVLQKVYKQFGGLQAINNVGFAVQPGSIKAVIGPNGAGKTTLFNLIAGNMPVTSGTIIFQGQEIRGKKPYEIARMGMARTFQNIKLFPGMTALECVMVGRHTQSRAGFWAGLFSLPWTWQEERAIRHRSMELLEMLAIADLADVEVSGLAFGQQRAVEMARALAAEPSLLLLDEPAAGLNIYETAEVARLITTIRDMGITVLLVEHDMSLVMDVSDEIVVLSFGSKVAEDTPPKIQKNADVIKIYLGEDGTA
ncbi:ABC transporter ATP-binding protein [Desulfobulbus oligotrophicus]|uniref:ABC transporter ATP-binding protein n=1 Tax=Desulfobulbus oligotrophicus TaxID=1909699 RepID=A0A7T6APV0_9BACT|nr:ABC transporter ATP-binding protein [Desulfobulbus oligotrophicus]QQG64775.1 ABC transporter ATP-binding protein [Desulfobulbus oligotrophicus]